MSPAPESKDGRWQGATATASSLWQTLLSRCGGRIGFLALFALLYAAAVALGYGFKEPIGELAILWPASGLLFSALCLSARTFWPAIIAVQIAVEIAAGAAMQRPFIPQLAILYIIANSVDALIGALLVGWLVGGRMQALAQSLPTARFMAATAVGAAASALLGAWANARDFFSHLHYLQELQIWWLANWLGSLVVAPVVIAWLLPLRHGTPGLELRSRPELALITVLTLGAAVVVFGVYPETPGSVLQMPLLFGGTLIIAAARLPPRWTATLVLASIAVAAALASWRIGEFAIDADRFYQTAWAQTFFVMSAALALYLTTTIAERKVSLGRLSASENRYRSFVERTSEIMWRVELAQPMPVALPVEEQLSWLRTHAEIAEASRSFERFEELPVAERDRHRWLSGLPWFAVYEGNAEEIAKRDFKMDGLRFTVELQGKPHTFLAAFDGMVEDGRLQRIWGVAQDITDLVELNSRLQREQSRLRGYAQQLVNAEEKARRAAAVDLHDGIGQSLIGMGMTLDVAGSQVPPEVRRLLDDVRMQLRDVQERTRNLISDLSPPGLYDLGLGPALQWLAVYLRSHHRLQVHMDISVVEEDIRLEARVTVFKLVRELLRNVIKHAGVDQARVVVRGDHDELRVEVSDQGRGFDWQLDMFGNRAGGFGLWSIADRVRELGGEFDVDAAPGRGSRFRLSFPLYGSGSAPAAASGF